ncbi:tetratricopeptide repeat protein [Paenibacillus taichungensis]|uniref:tetratricopeptide repeat protein n=1 Tax=Paenibacillus taichungensis TaxID=484184 RepID=UPI003D9A72C1
MNDLSIQNIVNGLVNQSTEESMEEAEKLILDYLNKFPQDVDAWARVVLLQTLPPFGDYQRAISLLDSAMEYNDNVSYFTILSSFFSEWFMGGMNDFQLEKLMQLKKNSSDTQTKAIILYLMAWHYESTNKNKFVTLVDESIKTCDYLVMNWVDLGNYYLQNGEMDKGKLLIQSGLANVKLIYKEDICYEDYDSLDVIRFINERITGVFMTEGRYNSIVNLTTT